VYHQLACSPKPGTPLVFMAAWTSHDQSMIMQDPINHPVISRDVVVGGWFLGSVGLFRVGWLRFGEVDQAFGSYKRLDHFSALDE